MDNSGRAEDPTMGGFVGREHHYPLRVFYEDTDYVENRVMWMIDKIL